MGNFMCRFVILLLLLSRNNGRSCSCEKCCTVPGDWARDTVYTRKDDFCECGCSACEQISESCAEPVAEDCDIWTSYRNTNKTIQK